MNEEIKRIKKEQGGVEPRTAQASQSGQGLGWKKFREYMDDFIKTKDEDIKYDAIDEAEYNILTAIEKARCFSDVFEKLHGEKEFRRFAAMLSSFIDDEFEGVQ